MMMRCLHNVCKGVNTKTRLVRSRAVYDDVAETLAQCSTGTVTLTVCDDSTSAASAASDISVTLEQSSAATVTLTVSSSAVVRLVS